MSLLLACVWMLVICAGVRAKQIMNLAYVKAPFLHYDHEGNRIVPKWTPSGNADIMQSFVRLTVDSPSHSGALYSRQSVDAGHPGEFSAQMKFRISGRGDGLDEGTGYLTLAMTDSDSSTQFGPFFGLRNDFYGLAVLIRDGETIDQRPPRRRQQVVELYVSNPGMGHPRKLGSCTAALRYREDRDNFSLLNASRIRLRSVHGSLTLEMDDRNLGMWKPCIQVNNLHTDLTSGMREMRVRLVAGLGSKEHATHDVQELQFWEGRDEAWQATTITSEDSAGAEEDDQLVRLIAHLEHELYDVNDQLSQSLDWLEERGVREAERIEQLERDLSTSVTERMSERLNQLELKVLNSLMPEIRQQVDVAQGRLEGDMRANVDSAAQQLNTAWKVPFALALLAMAGGVYLAWTAVRRIKRSNFL